MKNLYDILQIDKNSNEKEITKAYRRLAVINHPDKGGSKEIASKINAAKDRLLNR